MPRRAASWRSTVVRFMCASMPMPWSAVFDLRHVRGIVSGSIGQAPAPYGRLAGLLGRVLMLRASRREDRKRVPQYSSFQLP